MLSSKFGHIRAFNVTFRIGRFCFAVVSLFLFSSFFYSIPAQTNAQSDSQSGAQTGTQTKVPPPLLSDGPGKQVVIQKCTQCHGQEMFALVRKTPDDWDQTLTKMTTNGLVVTDEEYDVIMAYLTTNLGPLPPKINVNKTTAADLQKGLGLTDAEAQAIVKFRGDHGDFKTWSEVAKVDGVDPKKIEAKKDIIGF